MVDAPTVPPVPAETSAATAGVDDPFLRLHKMSITAGLGSGDYVAISGLAIAAVLAGVASAVVLFHSGFLLLVPLVGLVCAVLAWRQVGLSNGTLTGRGLAVLGGLLSLGLGGYEGGRIVSAATAAASARSQVVSLIHDFGQNVAAGQYQPAYDRCDAKMQAYVPLPTFEGTWTAVSHSPVLGKMTGIEWNHLLNFETDPLTGQQIAAGMVLVNFDRSPEPVRTDMFFQLGDHGWVISRIPQYFPPPDPAGEKAGPQRGRTGPRGPQSFGPPKPG